MSASGISDANPVMPASWAPAPQGDPPPRPAHERRAEANDGMPPKGDEGMPPKPTPETFQPTQKQHKVDVRA
jgi:hypothetical protein